jgi:hypothetical protein
MSGTGTAPSSASGLIMTLPRLDVGADAILGDMLRTCHVDGGLLWFCCRCSSSGVASCSAISGKPCAVDKRRAYFSSAIEGGFEARGDLLPLSRESRVVDRARDGRFGRELEVDEQLPHVRCRQDECSCSNRGNEGNGPLGGGAMGRCLLLTRLGILCCRRMAALSSSALVLRGN